MRTAFITFTLNLADARGNWHHLVGNRLGSHGAILRWAITEIDETDQTATIEAVVTQTAAADD
jgi:23S rRNA U2552 (ribose-2'-O)-methylase RlmE/FtsJ